MKCVLWKDDSDYVSRPHSVTYQKPLLIFHFLLYLPFSPQQLGCDSILVTYSHSFTIYIEFSILFDNINCYTVFVHIHLDRTIDYITVLIHCSVQNVRVCIPLVRWIGSRYNECYTSTRLNLLWMICREWKIKGDEQTTCSVRKLGKQEDNCTIY